MLSLNERPTLKARVECANRELESEQNNNVLNKKKKCEEKEGPETRFDRASAGSRPSVPFHVAPSSALRCGHCLSAAQ